MDEIKKTILQIAPRGQGGISTVVKSILNTELADKYRIIWIPTTNNKSRIIPFLKSVISCLRLKQNCVLAHIHTASKGSYYRKSIIARILAYKKIPYVIQIHGGGFRDFYNRANKIVKSNIKNTLSRSKSIILLTDDWLGFMHELNVSNKTVVIPNFTRIPTKIADNRKDPYKLLFIGKIVKSKGVYDLVKAIDLLVKEYNIKNLKCLIAGDGEIKKVKKYISTLKLDKYIDVLGWCDEKEKEKLYLASNVFVLPSYYESFGLVLIEAMSYMLPIVSTKAGAIPSVVIDGEDGFLVDVGDYFSIAAKIKTLYDNNDFSSRMGQNGRNHVIHDYSEASFCSKLDHIYSDID